MRGLQQQQQQQQQQHLEKSSSGMQLKWTETPRQMVQPVESLADIQAEQQRQFFKVNTFKIFGSFSLGAFVYRGMLARVVCFKNFIPRDG